MKQLPAQEQLQTVSAAAQTLWEEIVYSMDQFTCDSPLSKFYMPEELLNESRPIAAAFAMLHFSPFPKPKDIYRTKLYSIFLFAITCGTQAYLKQQAKIGRRLDFSFKRDKRDIKHIKNSILRQLVDGVSISEPIDEVMSLFLKQLLPMKKQLKTNKVGAFFNEEMFEQFLPITLAWGYLFAQEMIQKRDNIS